MSVEAAAAILLMGLASYACRAGGFWMMGLVRPTPRLGAALRAIPIAVMGAVLAPAIARAGPAEAAGFAVAFLAMRVVGNDLLAVAGAVAAVAGLRALGA
ncbi:MAG: AzlD family protein [Alphaproteobacteria bacterium]